MNILPIGDKIIVQPTAARNRTDTGIYIPDGATVGPVQGRVAAVGTGTYNDDGSNRPLRVHVGDIVWYNKSVAPEINLGGEVIVILREMDILGIVQ